MERGLQTGLVRADHPRVRPPGGSRPTTAPGFAARTAATDQGRGPWVEKLVAHFIRLGTAPGGHERLLESSDAVVSTLRQAVERGLRRPALDLVRVAAPAFELSARWGAWASTLEVGLQAARDLNDRSAEGWILHEQGVRAMALGHHDEAEELLSQALAIRTDLGAEDDIERTRSQLAQACSG